MEGIVNVRSHEGIGEEDQGEDDEEEKEVTYVGKWLLLQGNHRRVKLKQ